MRYFFIIFTLVLLVAAQEEKHDTLTFINCRKDTVTVIQDKCDTLKIAVTYKDTMVIIKLDTLKQTKKTKTKK